MCWVGDFKAGPEDGCFQCFVFIISEEKDEFENDFDQIARTIIIASLIVFFAAIFIILAPVCAYYIFVSCVVVLIAALVGKHTMKKHQ